MINQTTVVGGLVAIVVAAIGLYQAIRTSDIKKEVSSNKEKIEASKAEALAKAEKIKIETETETRRIDQLVDLAMDRIRDLQTENKDQRKEMNEIRATTETTRTKLDLCLQEKTAEGIDFSKRIASLEAENEKMKNQFEMTKRYLEKEDLIDGLMNKGDSIKP